MITIILVAAGVGFAISIIADAMDWREGRKYSQKITVMEMTPTGLVSYEQTLGEHLDREAQWRESYATQRAIRRIGPPDDDAPPSVWGGAP
jgi:hypothetical protein